MRQLIEIASELQGICDSKRWQSCVIGGLAVQRWGEPRLTRDGRCFSAHWVRNRISLYRSLLALYQGRVTDPAAFALRNRVLLLQKGGIGIDIALFRNETKYQELLSSIFSSSGKLSYA
jgi:hypothetical protein